MTRNIDWELVEARMVVDWDINIDAITVAKEMARREHGDDAAHLGLMQAVEILTGYTFTEWCKEAGI